MLLQSSRETSRAPRLYREGSRVGPFWPVGHHLMTDPGGLVSVLQSQLLGDGTYSCQLFIH